MKVYRTRGWARRACSRVKWHTVEEVARGFVVRPMTAAEIERCQIAINLSELVRTFMLQAIEAELHAPSAMFNLLKRSPK
jgi:hypothetical protein